MNCADARHWIHLDAGGDLLQDEELSLARHMERCAECRAYNSGMLRAMNALQTLRDFDADAFQETGTSGMTLADTAFTSNVADHDADGQIDTAGRPSRPTGRQSSVWTELSRRLPPAGSAATRKQFDTRVAALCACSLVLALVSIVQNLPVANYSPDNMSQMSGQWSAYVDQGPMAGSHSRVSHARNPPMVSTVLNPQADGTTSRFPVLNPDGSIAGYLQFEGAATSDHATASF